MLSKISSPNTTHKSDAIQTKTQVKVLSPQRNLKHSEDGNKTDKNIAQRMCENPLPQSTNDEDTQMTGIEFVSWLLFSSKN